LQQYVAKVCDPFAVRLAASLLKRLVLRFERSTGFSKGEKEKAFLAHLMI
jgi:hypothetical protein